MSYEVHEPMEIYMVTDGRTTGPDLDIDQDWSELDKLRWHAGAVKAKTGITVRITTGGRTVNGVEVEGQFGYSLSGFSAGGSYDYHEMWILLTGIEMGAQRAAGH